MKSEEVQFIAEFILKIIDSQLLANKVMAKQNLIVQGVFKGGKVYIKDLAYELGTTFATPVENSAGTYVVYNEKAYLLNGEIEYTKIESKKSVSIKTNATVIEGATVLKNNDINLFKELKSFFNSLKDVTWGDPATNGTATTAVKIQATKMMSAIDTFLQVKN